LSSSHFVPSNGHFFLPEFITRGETIEHIVFAAKIRELRFSPAQLTVHARPARLATCPLAAVYYASCRRHAATMFFTCFADGVYLRAHTGGEDMPPGADILHARSSYVTTPPAAAARVHRMAAFSAEPHATPDTLFIAFSSPPAHYTTLEGFIDAHDTAHDITPHRTFATFQMTQNTAAMSAFIGCRLLLLQPPEPELLVCSVGLLAATPAPSYSP